MSGFNPYSVIFYGLGLIVLASSLLAVTRRNPVHAVMYLIASFLGTAAIFYLLGAPLLAALEVILYAGAFMVLFLFIIMTVKPAAEGKSGRARARRWLLPAALAGVSLFLVLILVGTDPGGRMLLPAAMAQPAAFGRVLFERYWFSIEVASFLLFVALVGALYLGRRMEDPTEPTVGGER